MKTQLQVIATLATLVAAGVVHADLPQKAATRIEFNNMIDSNNNEKQELQKVTSKSDSEDDSVTEQTEVEKKKVLDLVDMEVGVGEDRPVVVDRRFNSVGEPVVDKSFSNAKVQLVDDKATAKDSGT